MALSPDQKKHLLIGGGVGALAIVLGSMLLGDGKARAAALPGGHGGHGAAPRGEHSRARRKKRHDDDRDDNRENGRGEYGRKKKHHHKEHGHGG